MRPDHALGVQRGEPAGDAGADVGAVRGEPVPGPDPSLDLGALSAVAAAIRGRERLRFAYRSHAGAESTRHVEPYRLVSWGSRWYLFAWDLDRDDWRVFRADRVVPRAPTGARFTPRPLPEGSVAEHVAGRVRRATWRYRARIEVHAPAEVVEAALGAAADVEPVGPGRCRVDVGSDDPDRLALWITQLDADVEVIEGRELADAFARLAARMRRAARTASG
ncbi:helix-turn-helix transcriptional regulator [Isoptericola sp. G70]|uniref:helix-turn-helix transcriptional regulator n=1 Tax=Isoptericola sp. G70 TaxID=3376633 RepID=UPI003A80A9BC